MMNKFNEAYDATLDNLAADEVAIERSDLNSTTTNTKPASRTGRRRASSKTESSSTSGQTDESGLAGSPVSDTSQHGEDSSETIQQEESEMMEARENFKKNITYVTVNGNNMKMDKNITQTQPTGTATTIDISSSSSFKSSGSISLGNDSDQNQPEKTKVNEGMGHFSINWHNLDYVVESKWYKLANQRKPILNDLSGSIKSGELTAILGPSGAGKSTLIDCLLGKRTTGLRGQTRVTFSDSRLEAERRRKRPLKIATIPQEDHLLDTLTVMETFMFASKIKNAHLTYEPEDNFDLISGDSEDKLNLKIADGKKSKTSKMVLSKKRPRRPFDHYANVQRVIQQLSLASCSNLKCGKLSGGQYKRVSIGQELLSRPDIMILDEPTSGLDSVTCYQTVNALRALIDSSPYPMAIVATIHQPDIDVFNLFHKAYVLASGGRAIYEGSTAGIFDTVQLGLEIAEAREIASISSPLSSSSKRSKANFTMDSEHTVNLRRQLEERRGSNPARLIVEVAANEYGFEITSVLNELQRRDHESYTNPTKQQPINTSLRLAMGSSASTSSMATTSTVELQQPPKPPSFDYEFHDPTRRRADLDKLLHLVSANMNQRRSIMVLMKHLIYHTHRSWVTILRDPMLFSVQVLLHIFVPLLISYAFQNSITGDACPLLGQLDVIDEAYRSGNILDDLNKELRMAFENLGYMFFQIYVIIFAAVCVTSLTYPLAMHVLLKEYRNGWYSMSSYFLGRTLADLPVPTFNVFLAMGISYHLTGQPLSPYAWRFMSVAILTVLATLVAQTMGLMFGAMLMNAPQAAVFVAPASTAPLVVVSGFLIRIKNLPKILQFLSKFSYFTHLLNGFIISRYGFNRCPCDESDFVIDEARQVPQQARTVIDIWVETFKDDYPDLRGQNGTTNVNLVGKLVETITRAKMFNHEMKSCADVKPFSMLDYELSDGDLQSCFLALMAMLILFRWMTYIVLTWKIKSSI